MTYALWTPPLPVVPIMDGSTDEERLIKGRCWDLPAVQQALPADAYQMGFNRIQGVENYRFEPHVYMKWAVREAVSEVVVFSFHQSTR